MISIWDQHLDWNFQAGIPVGNDVHWTKSSSFIQLLTSWWQLFESKPHFCNDWAENCHSFFIENCYSFFHWNVRSTYLWGQSNNNDDDRRNSRFSTISSLRCELSPTCMLKRPGRNRVQIIFDTLDVHHVICHVVWRESSATKSDSLNPIHPLISECV